jgi:hypothetical protein
MSVVHRASVRLGDGHIHRFARHGGVQGVVQVVARDLQAGRVGGGLVVDGSLVDEFAGGKARRFPSRAIIALARFCTHPGPHRKPTSNSAVGQSTVGEFEVND